MGEDGLIQKEDIESYYEELNKEKKEYDKIIFKLFWFTKEKSDAHIEVLNYTQCMYGKMEKIKNSKETDPSAEGNRFLIKTITDNMIVLTKKYYPKNMNLFIKSDW